MTVEELVLALDNARDNARVLVAGYPTGNSPVIEVQADENGNIVLITKELRACENNEM